ncbi:MAG TPA: hypothetical protein VMZ53_05395 [Kofleriaceae bacterium]|nr:hypothetical protein [Kofleriaceae bacterium]
MFGSSLIAVAALVGCGGDDGKPVVPDAKKFMDAAPDAPHLCGVMDSLGTLTFGSMAMPVVRQNFDVPTTGADMGKLEFFIAARLSMGTTPPIDALILDVIKPTAGFMTNTPYAFETDATATGSIVADAMVFGDFDGSQTIQNLYWAQQGALTFTAFTGAGAPTAKDSKINGTVTMVPFKEIDQETGELMPGGCSTSIGGLTFFLQQSEVAPTPTVNRPVEGSDPMLEAAIERYKGLKAARKLQQLQ